MGSAGFETKWWQKPEGHPKMEFSVNSARSKTPRQLGRIHDRAKKQNRQFHFWSFVNLRFKEPPKNLAHSFDADLKSGKTCRQITKVSPPARRRIRHALFPSAQEPQHASKTPSKGPQTRIFKYWVPGLGRLPEQKHCERHKQRKSATRAGAKIVGLFSKSRVRAQN